MLRLPSAVLSLIQILSIGVAVEGAEPESPLEQFNRLVEQYEEAGGTGEFAAKFFDFAAQHAKHPVAVDALLWVVKNRRNRPDATHALELLAKHHLTAEKLGPACPHIARTPSAAAEHLLRAAMDKTFGSPSRPTTLASGTPRGDGLAIPRWGIVRCPGVLARCGETDLLGHFLAVFFDEGHDDPLADLDFLCIDRGLSSEVLCLLA